ncbi:MAG: hypothetical protein R3C32_13490 [Chloroflexota bacterium]
MASALLDREAAPLGVATPDQDAPLGVATPDQDAPLGVATPDVARPPGPLGVARHRLSPESFALAWGAIEVPPDGAPIVLLPDGPTVGGYPVPLVVARIDLPRLGQLRPGDRVRFRWVTPGWARTACLAADDALERARASLAVMRSVW